MRSWIFVPADSEKKLGKARNLSADHLIFDLEDSVSPGNKAGARKLLSSFLAECDLEKSRVWVRINPLTTPDHVDDLSAVLPAGPGGIMLPKARSPEDVKALAVQLDRLENEHGLPAGSTKILPLVTETPEALFSLGDYRNCSERLAGLSWGAEDLGSAIGATRVRDAFGNWTSPFQMVRNLCLFAAHAAGVPAIDTVHTDFRDVEGLGDACAEARRDGFAGKLAIHPAQVEIINNSFQPSEAEVEWAQKVVDLFEDNPDAGVLELDGVMLDRPHLLQARRILGS